MAVMYSMQTAIATIVVFGLIVFIHELGHFLVAKKVGILVREFAIGFGPKLVSFKKGETVYSIRVLPLGGFVRMAGEDPETYDMKNGVKVGLTLDADLKVVKVDLDPHERYEIMGKIEAFDIEKEMFIRITSDTRSATYYLREDALIVKGKEEMQVAPLDRKFNGKTVGQRMAAISAGPIMNFLLAGLLFAAVFAITGMPTDSNIIGEVVPGSPAATAGIESGDQIVKIEGTTIQTWQELVTQISSHANQAINLEIQRGGQILPMTLTPEEQDGSGKIGIMQMTEDVGWMSIPYGFQRTYEMAGLLLTSLGEIVTGRVEADLAGPVGIVQMIGIQANAGIERLINFAGFLSLNLGIINLLPFPALDGGRLVFLALEGLRGKPVDPNKEGLVHFVGFALLMLLIVIVTYHDVVRIFD